MFELHHIGFLVADIPVATADFVERYGYVVESSIIEDMVQTARVQFLRQPGAIHWLELITPAGSDSKLSDAMQRGGGLHHLCYEVPSIELASEQLRRQKMLPLGKASSAVAFSERKIAWFMDRASQLVELVEAGLGDFNLASIR